MVTNSQEAECGLKYGMQIPEKMKGRAIMVNALNFRGRVKAE
jgi:hypothetical protein